MAGRDATRKSMSHPMAGLDATRKLMSHPMAGPDATRESMSYPIAGPDTTGKLMSHRSLMTVFGTLRWNRRVLGGDGGLIARIGHSVKFPCPN